MQKTGQCRLLIMRLNFGSFLYLYNMPPGPNLARIAAYATQRAWCSRDRDISELSQLLGLKATRAVYVNSVGTVNIVNVSTSLVST